MKAEHLSEPVLVVDDDPDGRDGVVPRAVEIQRRLLTLFLLNSAFNDHVLKTATA
jgi:hypothetical protein